MPSMREMSPFVPFDLYDFFGYLFPGILFMANAIVFYIEIDTEIIKTLSPFIVLTNSSEISFIAGLAIVLASIVILYTIGHFIATLSYILIDRVLIEGVGGYPINYLLDIKREVREYSESTFKYLFSLFNLIILTPLIFSDYSVIKFTITFLLVLICFLIAQRTVVMLVREKIGKDYSHKMGDKWFFRSFLIPSIFIIDPFIGFLKRLLGIDKPFPNDFIVLYKKLFKERFPSLDSNLVGTENYWLSVFHSYADHEAHQRQLHTWLHLYGFARNACAAFYLSSILIIGHLLLNPSVLSIGLRVHLGIIFACAVMLGLRYWNLFAHYYSKGVIRIFVESNTRK